jgi:long-chain acyl-CoA synthetase
MTNLVELAEASRQRYPDRIALRLFDRTVTYSELIDNVEKAAGGLVKLGIRKGDRVAIFAENCPEYLVLYLAVAKIGAILATINPLFKEEEIGYILTNAAPRLVFVQAPLEPLLQRCYGVSPFKPERTICLGPYGGQSMSYDDFLTLGVHHATDPAATDDGVVICYTSGSMSRPKPVFKSHGAELFLSRAHAKVWHIGIEDRTLVALPMAWLFGLTTTSMSTISAGGTVVYIPHFNPVVAMEQMHQQRITLFAGVMTMFAKMLQVSEESQQKYDLASLRFCVQGGEPRNEAVAQRFTAKFGVPIHDIYATSECSPNFTYDPIRDPAPKPGSCGRLVDGVDARLIDNEGKDVPVGTVGELVVRCPGLMLGYFGEPALTAEVIKDGWFLSRDLVRVDEDGYYYVTGRTKDLIIRGGANIAPAEVELVIARHPAVSEVAVIGIPDAIYGEQPKAYVVLRAGQHTTAEEISAFCAERLAKFKVPTQIEFIAQFPKGPTGKVLKNALKAMNEPARSGA